MAVEQIVSHGATVPARGLGPSFSLLWTAWAVSDLGSSITMVALPLVAVVTLEAPAEQVAAVAAAGALAGALGALPLGTRAEYRLKRPAMVTADLVRAAALVTVPIAAVLGVLTLAQLCLVAFLIACAGIVFNAASHAHLKALVGVDRLGAATSRLPQVGVPRAARTAPMTERSTVDQLASDDTSLEHPFDPYQPLVDHDTIMFGAGHGFCVRSVPTASPLGVMMVADVVRRPVGVVYG